jgi:hypothetical protein
MLYKEILRKPKIVIIPPKNQSSVETLLKQAVVFNVNNIAEYVQNGPKQLWNIGEDIPNLAPPFPLLWMEYSPPKLVDTENGLKENPFPYKTGALIGGKEASSLDIYENSNIKWVVRMDVCNQIDGKIFFLSRYVFWVSSAGEIIKHPISKNPVYHRELTDGFAESLSEDGVMPIELDSLMLPFLLAISFLHCKNVTMIETGRIKRQYHCKNKNREPETKVYTLEIEPMKKVLKTEGKSEETGLKRALHICRGHFKDFREKGLFGKFKGIYWWDSQVRGNSKYGTIDKDYNVNPPQEG